MLRLIALVLILTGCAGGAVDEFSHNPKAAEANAELGKSYLQRGDYEVAMGKLKRALRFNAESVNANHYIAELYRRLNKMNDADRHYKLAIKYSVNDSALNNNYGVYLCGEKRVDEALVQFESVLKNPVYRYPELVHENIGLCMLQNGRMKMAEESLRKAVSVNPKLPKSLFELSKISFQRERLFSARAFINRHLEISEPSAENLWHAMEIETKLKDATAVKNYRAQILKEFPLSDEAAKIHRLNK